MCTIEYFKSCGHIKALAHVLASTPNNQFLLVVLMCLALVIGSERFLNVQGLQEIQTVLPADAGCRDII